MAGFLFRRSLAARTSTTHRVVVIKKFTRDTSTSSTYGISALSNRHETQHFHRLSRLPLMEHSPTLKLIHTSEVAPGAPSAPFSSSSTDSSLRQQDKPIQDGSGLELKATQGSRDIKNEKTLSPVVEEYRKGIQDLNKRLDWHTIRLTRLQKIVEKQTEDANSESKLPPGTGNPSLKEESHEHGLCWTEVASTILLMIVTFAALYQSSKYQGEALYYKALYEGQQKERNSSTVSAPAPLNDCEYLEFENKAQIRVTVERIIDGVSDKNSHAHAGTEQSGAAESDSQATEPDRSWSSLFWRKR